MKLTALWLRAGCAVYTKVAMSVLEGHVERRLPIHSVIAHTVAGMGCEQEHT